ncbi:hypothetical protein MTO96_034668 [Rhipicephalus appendiculatus]
MLMLRSAEACFSGTSPGRGVRRSDFTGVQPRRPALHVAQPHSRHAAVPVAEAGRHHALQQQQHGRRDVSKLLPKVTTHQLFDRTADEDDLDGTPLADEDEDTGLSGE